MPCATFWAACFITFNSSHPGLSLHAHYVNALLQYSIYTLSHNGLLRDIFIQSAALLNLEYRVMLMGDNVLSHLMLFAVSILCLPKYIIVNALNKFFSFISSPWIFSNYDRLQPSKQFLCLHILLPIELFCLCPAPRALSLLIIDSSKYKASICTANDQSAGSPC